MDDGRRRKTDKANANLEQLIDKELLRQKKDMWQFMCGCPARSRDVRGENPATLDLSFGGNQGAIDIAAQVGVQTFAAVSTAVYSAVATWLILKAVDATVGLRAPAGAEAAGMDQYSFGEDAYVEE